MSKTSIKLQPQPRKLSKSFYETYSNHRQILKSKGGRVYLLMEFSPSKTLFAIPFVSELKKTKHQSIPYGHIFKADPKDQGAGLNFRKAIVITDEKFLAETVTISRAQYSHILKQQNRIINAFNKFLKYYRRCVHQPDLPDAKNLLKFCTLKYFHDELKDANLL